MWTLTFYKYFRNALDFTFYFKGICSIKLNFKLGAMMTPVWELPGPRSCHQHQRFFFNDTVQPCDWHLKAISTIVRLCSHCMCAVCLTFMLGKLPAYTVNVSCWIYPLDAFSWLDRIVQSTTLFYSEASSKNCIAHWYI